MTLYGQQKFNEAILIWSHGKSIDAVLFSQLVSEGYDVPKLEIIYKTEEK